MFRRLAALLLLGLIGLGVVSFGHASPKEPPGPDAFNALVRYEILNYRSERVRAYFDFMKALKEIGFTRDPSNPPADDEPDNPQSEPILGSLPAGKVDALLALRPVRSVLLFPKGTKLPEKGARLRVQFALSSGYLPQTQRALFRQTVTVLAKDLGFIEAVGYDHRGYTKLLGSVPAENALRLLDDVRKLPSAVDVGAPLSNVTPLRLTIARPDWPAPSGRTPAPPVPEKEKKFTPELRTLLAGPDADKSTRFEVILGWTPDEFDRGWQGLLEGIGAVVEGRVGPLVTVVGSPKKLSPALAELREVAHVRLPRSGAQRFIPATEEGASKWEPLRASGLVKIHAMGRKGAGTRVAIIADDFAGWEKLKGRKDGDTKLPDPTLLDLTAERNSDLRPDPFPSKSGEGYGTRCARSFLRAAPEAELTLIRLDPFAPYQLQTVARAINGEGLKLISLEQRLAELREDRNMLDRQRTDLEAERQLILDNPAGDEQGLKLAAEYRKKRDAFEALEKTYEERRDRYFRLYRDLAALKGVRLVASTLVWTEGFPVDGSSSLSRYFADRPFRAALWFQAAGDSGGQTWTGLFRDEDQNGILEFVGGSRPMLPTGSWSPELNFLGWQPLNGAGEKTLPAGAQLRISLQWREAHASLPLKLGEDLYREPLAKFNLVVVRQADPSGKTRPADDLDVVASSGGQSIRLNQTTNAATYEQVVELRITQPGRYAVFVEGKLPEDIVAPGEASLPSTRRVGEIRPRLFVGTLAGSGRAVWSDFTTAQASLGMPADARPLVAVAALGPQDQLRSASAGGPPAGLTLAHKPEVLAYDNGGGTGEAASFAAGFAAAAWPVTGTLYGVLERMRIEPGAVLRVPERVSRPR
ncbi:MAG: hypothetical protein U0840_24560 [Gemmataceae bacterium]